MNTPVPSIDKDALIASLLERIEVLMAQNGALAARVAELEAKLGLPPKTPNNSSLPPSKGRKPSLPSVPKRKAKPPPGAHRLLHPNPTRHHDVLALACQACGADVSGTEQSPCETYDRVEIPKIDPDVTRVSLHGGTCPCCDKRFKAEAPAGLEPGSPFGANIRAFVIHLRAVQDIPLSRLRDVLLDLFGLSISEGALVNMLSASAKPFKAVVAAFLGDHRPDFWTSDRYGAQAGWAKRQHQVCLAHLIRDVQYAVDAGDTVLGPGLKGLLKRACAIGRRRADLKEATLKAYEADMERTNNGSERALRPCAVYRKITNGFRQEWGAHLYADIRSVIETARRRAIRAIDAIRLTLKGQPLHARGSAAS